MGRLIQRKIVSKLWIKILTLRIEVGVPLDTSEILNFLIIIIVSILLIYFLTQSLGPLSTADEHREALVAVVSLRLMLGRL